MRQVIAVSAELMVEGTQHTAGRFQGRVIAVAIDDEAGADAPAAGATWLLVADDRKPAPVWVALADVSAQRLGR